MPAIAERFILLIAACGVIAIGLFTFYKNQKSATNRLFLLFSGTLFAYIIANYLSLHQAQVSYTTFLIRAVMAIVSLMNLSYVLLVATFPNRHIPIRRPLLLVMILSTVTLMAMAFSPLIFTRVIIDGVNITPVPGLGMPFFLIHTIATLGGGFVLLIRKYRASKGLLRAQFQYFLLGTIVFYVSTFASNYIVVLVFNSSLLVGFLPVYALAFVGSIGYAVVRHRFMDINMLVTRTVTYTLLVVFVAVVLAVILYLPGEIWLGLYFSPREELGIITLTVLIALLFQFLRRNIEKFTDSFFYKNKYDSTKLLYDLALIMASTLHLEDLSHEVLRTLMKQVSILKGAFILLKDNVVIDVKSEGFESTMILDEEEVRDVSQASSMLIFDDMEEGPKKDILRRLDIAVVVHLRTEGKQIGLLVLGQKKSGDMYTEADIRLLDILAPEVAVAIQNSQAYEEIRRFNVTLQEEVDKATEDLRQANVKLQELDKLKDEFVSLASHELRTPLTAIRSYVWMALSGKGGEVPEKEKYYLDRAFSSANRLIKLVNDMLNISRIESGRVSVQFGRGNITKILEDVVGEVKPRIEEQGLRLVMPGVTGVPDVVVDADKIKEVLINLIGNAIKFTPKGGAISLGVAHEGSMVAVTVADTGIGMDPSELGKLFKKFGTVQSGAGANANVFQSTGLGLYISKSIITMHGGMITAASGGRGKGSAFRFTLPVYADTTRESMQRLYPSEGVGIIHSTIG